MLDFVSDPLKPLGLLAVAVEEETATAVADVDADTVIVTIRVEAAVEAAARDAAGLPAHTVLPRLTGPGNQYVTVYLSTNTRICIIYCRALSTSY